MHEDAMAYPGDFVAANRAARTDPQHAAIHLCKKRRVFRSCLLCYFRYSTTQRRPDHLCSRCLASGVFKSTTALPL